MRHTLLFALLFLCCGTYGHAQQDSLATIENMTDKELDALFDDLDELFDDILKPKSYATVSLMAANRLINRISNSGEVGTAQTLMLSPNLGYYHKSGLGISGSAALFPYSKSGQPNQYLATASYDMVRTKRWATGLAYTRFFNEASSEYYTSPLKNEASAYLSYRKSWVKPSLALSYGWGSRVEVAEEETIFVKLRKQRFGGVTRTEYVERISDWAASLSLRHDFNHFGWITKGDNLRITPQLAVSGGTQRWGFNQTSNSYALRPNGSTFNKPYTSDQISLEERTDFQLLSLTAFLRTAYTKGKFFVQPQLVFDYFLPAIENPVTTTFMISTGLMF